MTNKNKIDSLLKRLKRKKDFSANQFQYPQAVQTLSKTNMVFDDRFEEPYTWDPNIWAEMCEMSYPERLHICSGLLLRERKRLSGLYAKNIDPMTLKPIENV